jgi:hypothetical protein
MRRVVEISESRSGNRRAITDSCLAALLGLRALLAAFLADFLVDFFVDLLDRFDALERADALAMGLISMKEDLR